MTLPIEPEDFDDPFEYSLTLGNAVEAYATIWRKWRAAEAEVERLKHELGDHDPQLIRE